MPPTQPNQPSIHEPRGSQEGKYEKGIGFDGGRVFKHLAGACGAAGQMPFPARRQLWSFHASSMTRPIRSAGQVDTNIDRNALPAHPLHLACSRVFAGDRASHQANTTTRPLHRTR
jgi:hypothetical protein